MKKFLSILSAGAIAALTVPTIVSAEALEITEEQYNNCDFNGNGKIDQGDAHLLLAYYAEQTVRNSGDDPNYESQDLTDEIRSRIFEHGELNGDGDINAIDASILLSALENHGVTLVKGYESYDDLMTNYVDRSDENTTIPDELYYNCDFSGNGEIDYMDAQMILVYYSEIAVGHESDKPYMNAEVREKIAKYGDVYDDGVDGEINASDAAFLLSEIRRRGDRWTIRADFNNDGLINTEDVYLLLAPIVAEKGTVDLTFYGENEPFYTTSSIAEGYEEVLDEILKNGDIDCNGVLDETDVSALLDWRYFYHGHDAGDINCDGAVDAVDASAVLTYYAKMSTKPETVTVSEELAFMFSGDYNRDGVVDVLDASAILTSYAINSVQS